MYCANCGKELDAKSKFCPECGAKVVKEVKEAIVQEATQETAKEETVKENVQDTAKKEQNTEETPAEKTVKEQLDEAVDSAKKKGEEFMESDAVKDAKKEFNNIINEARSANDIQSGKVEAGAASTAPRESVSFFVDWFYWTGRRGRMKYLLIAILLSLCSFAFGSTGILSLLFCYMSAVNLIKRLHDFEKPGWYAFVLMLIEYALISLTWLFGIVGLGVAATGALSGLLLWLVPLLIVWAIKLWVFFIPGTKGVNKYGPEN